MVSKKVSLFITSSPLLSIMCTCILAQTLSSFKYMYSTDFSTITRLSLGNRSGGLVWRGSAPPGGSKGFAGACGPATPAGERSPERLLSLERDGARA